MASKLAKVVITLDGSKVEVGLDKIRSKVVQLTNEMDKLAREGKQNTKEYKDRLKAVNKLHKAEMDVADVTQRINTYMKNLGNVATTDLRRAYREGVQLREGFKGTDAELKKLNADLAAMKAQIDANTGAVNRSKTAWGTLGTTIKNLFAYAGIFAGFNMLKSKIQEIYELNKQFSDSMANVRKVSGLAMEDISKLANNLSQIDSRTSLQGLMELSYTGAKLGFGNYGIEGLESFARSAVKVQNALSEDMGEDSMTALSKLVEVMGLIPKMGVERAMDAAGSAIFKLASTSTATGTNIIEFTKRLMGLANVSHVTTAELLALGSASDSMGLMAEVSATAFNKVFTSIQSNTTAIEKALGFAKGELIDLVNQGRTMDAIVAVFEKMHGMSMDQLKNQGVFKALGSDGARLNNVMITMSNRIDMLKDHLQTSNQAFAEGTAVAQEYAIQMDTAAAYSERAANIWNKAFVNPEGVDTVKEFTKAWYDVSVSMTNNKVVMGEIKFLLAGILELMKGIVSILPSILYGLTTIGAYRLGAAIATGLKPGIEAVKGMTLSLSALRTGFMALSTAARANIVGVAVTAVFALVSAFGLLNKKIKEASGYMDGFKSDLSDLNLECAKGEAELRRYRRAIDEANVGTKQRAAAIAQFNSKFKPYLSNMLTEKSTALDVAKAYNEITKAMRTKLALQLKEKDIEQQVMPREQWTAQRREEYDAAARAAGFGQYGSSWITGYAQDNAKKTVSDAVRNIGKQFYNMPQQVLDEVMKQVNAGARSFNNYGNIINSKYLKQADALIAASNYIRQDRAATEAMNRVNKKWKPEQDAMDAMLAAQNKEEPITPIDETRPDPDELKQLKKEQQEYKQALRKDLKDAKEQSDAIISKIEEWYRLQESVITGMAADGQLTQEQAQRRIDTLNIAKNTALRDARLAISGRNTEAWEKTKLQIGNMMLDHGEWSADLLEQILKVSTAAIRSNLSNIDKGGGKYGITTSSLRDDIDKKAAGNQREVNRILNKAKEDVQKLLEKYNYLQQATRAFSDNLVKIGLLTQTTDALGNQITAKQTDDAAMSMLVAMMRQGNNLFAVNPSDAKAVAANIAQAVYAPMTEQDYLAGRQHGEQAKWFDLFPEIKDWMQNPEQHRKELENFFNVVLIAEQDYYTKRKQSYDNAKKQQDNRFRAAGFTDAEERTDTALQARGQLQDSGVGASFWQQQGLGSVADDPEVLRIQNRIYWRNEEVKAAEASLSALKAQQTEEMQMALERKASDEEIQRLEAEHDAARMGMEDLLHERKLALFEQETALTSKVAQELQKRIQTVNSLTKPVQDAANSVGKKLGEMIRGAEEESITWDEIWRNMAIAVGESVIDMMAAYAQNLIMEKAMNSESKQESVEKAEVDVAAGIASGSAKTIGTLGWWGIALIPVIAALLKGLLSEALSTANKGNSNNSKVKLVSGMLTYDEGNVGQYVGSDGHVYSARQQSALPEGVSIVKQPIATTVNGQPALVGEKGPEIVIGRRTSRRIMMNEPGLLQRIAQIERGGRFYTRGGTRMLDSGNVNDFSFEEGVESSEERGMSAETAAALQALPSALAAFTQMMQGIQQQGIPAKVAKYGDGSLDEGMREINAFRKKYPA